jgi:hypothetical protein
VTSSRPMATRTSPTSEMSDAIKNMNLPEGTEMVMPGDRTDMRVELIQPIAMEEGLRFAIREGGRTVGAGRVTKIIKLWPYPAAGPARQPGRRIASHVPTADRH